MNIELIMVNAVFGGLAIVITYCAYKLTIGVPKHKFWERYN